MSDFLLRVLRAWMGLPFRVAQLAFPKNRSKAEELVMVQACKAAERRSDHYFSFNMRPKSARFCRCPSDVHYDASDIAVVLQGPLDEADSFTVETARLYSSLYEGMAIIVSTWKDANPRVVEELDGMGVHVVASDYPENPGYGNINYQLASTKAGIDKAMSLGRRYVCKSRTDQRLYAPGAITYFKDLIDCNPVAEGSGPHGRIVCLTAEYAGMFTPFYVSDFLYFGKAEDMKRLFDLPLRKDHIDLPQNITRKQVASCMSCSESYIAYSYARKIDHACEPTVKDYLDFLAKNMVVVDRAQIGFYWHKYDRRYRDHSRHGFHHVGSDPQRYMSVNVNAFQWEEYLTGTMRLDDSVEAYASESLA